MYNILNHHNYYELECTDYNKLLRHCCFRYFFPLYKYIVTNPFDVFDTTTYIIYCCMLIHIPVLYLYKETAVLFNKIRLKPHSIPFSIVCIVDKVKSKLCVYNYNEYFFFIFFFCILYPIKNN